MKGGHGSRKNRETVCVNPALREEAGFFVVVNHLKSKHYINVSPGSQFRPGQEKKTKTIRI